MLKKLGKDRSGSSETSIEGYSFPTQPLTDPPCAIQKDLRILKHFCLECSVGVSHSYLKSWKLAEHTNICNGIELNAEHLPIFNLDSSSFCSSSQLHTRSKSHLSYRLTLPQCCSSKTRQSPDFEAGWDSSLF